MFASQPNTHEAKFCHIQHSNSWQDELMQNMDLCRECFKYCTQHNIHQNLGRNQWSAAVHYLQSFLFSSQIISSNLAIMKLNLFPDLNNFIPSTPSTGKICPRKAKSSLGQGRLWVSTMQLPPTQLFFHPATFLYFSFDSLNHSVLLLVWTSLKKPHCKKAKNSQRSTFLQSK